MSCNILRMKNINKEFSGVKVLKNVNFELDAFEIHALMGENGAGKSTLMKILNGLYSKNSGEIYLDEMQINPIDTNESRKLGINTVFQELNLIPHLSIYENITIGYEKKRGIFLDNKENIKMAKNILNDVMGINIDVETQLSDHSAALQQMVSIARALVTECKVLILDEPTSSLDKVEVENLFKVIRKLKEKGMGIIYISHKMEEVFSLCDRITILRDGEYISTYRLNEVDNHKIIYDMIGKDASEIINYKKLYTENSNSEVICKLTEVDSINEVSDLKKVNMEVRKGEILGLSGLLGSGRTEIVNTIFGLNKIQSGTIKIKEGIISNNNPQKVISLGLGLVPEERRKSGIIPNMSVGENLSLTILKDISKFGFINKEKERQIVDYYIKKLGVRLSSPSQLIKNLSGGNQQKVILARWLAKNSDFILLDEPTRGIDIGAKREIEKLMEQMSKEGKSLLMISSEMEEMVRNCDRTYVVVSGKIVSELIGEKINEETIVKTIADVHRKERIN